MVTSKVVSKVEGRLVRSPTDPEERDALRRRLIDEQTVRLVAQIGRTKIVENRLGIVAAAAGIDASNVQADEIALLPVDPDASAQRLRAGARRPLAAPVGVVVTDTQGRAWRIGVTDVAIGAAGLPVLDDHRGGVDGHGNELVVTMVAVGRRGGGGRRPGQGQAVRGAGRRRPWPARAGDRDTAAAAAQLIRPADEDLFRLGTDLALEQGRAQGRLAEFAAGRPTRSWWPPSTPTLQADAIRVLKGWTAPGRAARRLRTPCGTPTWACWRPGPTQRHARANPGTSPRARSSTPRTVGSTLLTLHPRVGRWVQLGGHCEPGDHDPAVQAALREATGGVRHRRAADRGVTRRTWTCTRSPARSAGRPGTSTCGTGWSRRRARSR